MPLLAALFRGIHLWWVGLLSNVAFYVFTVPWARRAFIVALSAAFMVTVGACFSALLSVVSSGAGAAGPLAGRFMQGVGMLIPSNAVAVMSCVASVWLTCVVYKLKLQALHW